METAYSHPSSVYQKIYNYDFLGGVTDSNYVNALYDCEIRYLDDLLKELDTFLDEIGIKDEVLLVLVAIMVEFNGTWNILGSLWTL